MAACRRFPRAVRKVSVSLLALTMLWAAGPRPTKTASSFWQRKGRESESEMSKRKVGELVQKRPVPRPQSETGNAITKGSSSSSAYGRSSWGNWWYRWSWGMAGTPSRPLNVVITGATRDIGFALAEEHLKNGDNVFVHGLRREAVDDVVRRFSERFPDQVIWGMAGDVADPDFVRMMGMYAQKWLGRIDAWINSAAITYPRKRRFLETKPTEFARVMNMNLLGLLYGTQTASLIMRSQNQGGHIFNVEASDNAPTPQFAAYGASKASMPQILKTLVVELQGTKVGVHNIAPGLALTALQLAGHWTDLDSLRVFNILAEKPETIAKSLVPQIRRTACSRSSTGSTIRYMSQSHVLWRCMTSGWRVNRWFDIWNGGLPAFNASALFGESCAGDEEAPAPPTPPQLSVEDDFGDEEEQGDGCDGPPKKWSTWQRRRIKTHYLRSSQRR